MMGLLFVCDRQCKLVGVGGEVGCPDRLMMIDEGGVVIGISVLEEPMFVHRERVE